MPPEHEIYAILTEIFHDVFDRRDLELTPRLSAEDVAGWDSLKQILIISAAEERFSIRMGTREMDSLRSVGDLVRIIAGKAR
jgi:acyl carrier protein